MEPSDRRSDKDVVLATPHSSPSSAGKAASQNPSRQVATPVFTPGSVICDRYKVLRFISRGGMGEVYEVADLELKTTVALKTISADRASSATQVNRFRQEIQLARKVSHPNVCRVFDLGRLKDENHGDVLFLTMEMLHGITLADYLRQHGPISCDEALPLIRQMVAALAAAHRAGIIHRDFKPGNVMLDHTPRGTVVKVTDFGLATNPESDETLPSSFTEIVGTPEYMAPEQLRGRCSSRTDVYALGLTVFQMLCGRLPNSYEAPFSKEDSGTGKRIGARWRNAIRRALAADPNARFATVEEFWCAISGESLPGPSGWKAIVAAAKRHPVPYAATGLVIVALVVLAFSGILRNPFRSLPQEKHLAVLPFDNVGNDIANQAFAEGVAESLTSKLSQLERYQKSFWVVPASDTRSIKSLDQAYNNLNVTLAVTGSIEHTPDGVNVITDLVDPKNHRQLASRSIHVDSTNLGDMQQRVWESVADMLDLQVSPEIKQELAAGGTTQPGSYELYEQGNGYLQRANADDVDRAVALFNKAVAKDPRYALPYAGLGAAYAWKYSNTKDPQWIAAASRNAAKAVELNDRLIPVRLTLARVYAQTGQLEKAQAEYQRVLEQDPTVVEAEFRVGEIYDKEGDYARAEQTYKDAIARRPDYWRGYLDLGALYYGRGQFAQAAQQFQSVIDLVPDYAEAYQNLGGAYLALGSYDDAVSAFRKGLQIESRSEGWTDLGAAYMYMGKWEEAADAMKRAADLSPHNHVMWRNLGDSYDQIPSRLADARQAYSKALEAATAELKINPKDPDVLGGIALYHAHLGDGKDAEAYIARALGVAPPSSDTLFTAALVYELIGRRDQALQEVDKAQKAGYSLEEIEKEPELRKLQQDPRYRRWLQEEQVAKK